MIWYTGTCGKMTIGLLYGLDPMITEVTLMDRPWIQLLFL